jgi:hypothetical protein
VSALIDLDIGPGLSMRVDDLLDELGEPGFATLTQA